jgi:hypothetical protein
MPALLHHFLKGFDIVNVNEVGPALTPKEGMSRLEDLSIGFRKHERLF